MEPPTAYYAGEGLSDKLHLAQTAIADFDQSDAADGLASLNRSDFLTNFREGSRYFPASRIPHGVGRRPPAPDKRRLLSEAGGQPLLIDALRGLQHNRAYEKGRRHLS
jgi:hypothetical protein